MRRNIDESFKQRKSKIELITFDINRNLQYQGFCKIKCNRITEALIVEPMNEDLETVTASFKWKIIIKKNILFIFGEKEFQDFALIFDKKIRCKKVYKLIFEKKEKDHVNEEQFQKRFLIPFYKELVENCATNESMKILIKNWIRIEDENEIKEEYLSLIANINCKKVDETENHTDISRKRKREISENSSSNKTTTKIIQQSNFKILNYKSQLRLQRRLVIFTSDQKTHCIQFVQKPHSTDFRCFGCKTNINRNIAYIFKDKNGNDCVKLGENSHQCKEFPYIPEDYVEIKYLKKPNFELWKNTENKNRQTLVIFDEMDKNFCYEYFWNSTKQLYACCGCAPKRYSITAKVFFDEKNEEYLEINDDNHICEKRQYEKEKYEKTYNYILKPDFEIRKKMKDGAEKQYLIIRDSSNKNKCYKYYNHYGNNFSCCRCATGRKHVTSKLHTNDENEEYVILSNIEHICKSVLYIPLKRDEIADEKILYPPAFKFLENNSNGAPKLFIFVKNNQKMCYIFHPVFGKEGNKYFCIGCRSAKIKECTVLDEFGQKIKGAVYVYLCKDSDGKLSVKLPNHQHICEPKNTNQKNIEI